MEYDTTEIIALVQCHDDGKPSKIDQASAGLGFEKLNQKVLYVPFSKLISMNGNDLHDYINRNFLENKILNMLKDDYIVVPFGNISFTRHVMYLTGIKEPVIPKIPEWLLLYKDKGYEQDILGRKVIPNVILEDIFYNPKSFFEKHGLSYAVIKPMKMKAMEIFKMTKDGNKDLEPRHYNLKEKVYVESYKDMWSEYRVYVIDGKIKNICNYMNKTDGVLLPWCYKKVLVIKKALEQYDPELKNYSFDIYVGKDDSIPCEEFGNPPMFNDTYFLEMHDFWALGNYGLQPEEFAQGLLNRWLELIDIASLERK